MEGNGTVLPDPDLSTEFCGLTLRHPVINGSGTFDAIAARRAFGDRLLDEFPFSAFVSKTITPEPRGWQSATAPLGDALRADQFHRASEQGTRRLPGPGPAGARRAAGAAGRLRDGDEPRPVRESGRGRRRPRGGRGARAERLLPQREVRSDRRRVARGGRLAAAARPAADRKTPAREANSECRGPGPGGGGGGRRRGGRPLAGQHLARHRARSGLQRSLARRKERRPLRSRRPCRRAGPGRLPSAPRCRSRWSRWAASRPAGTPPR